MCLNRIRRRFCYRSLIGCHGTKADDTQSRFWCRKSAPKIGADFWTVCHTDLVPDFSGTRFWRRSVACSVSCRFLVCTWPLRRPVIERNVLCTMSWLLITITGIDEMDSSIFASSMLIFGADFFRTRSHLVRKIGAEIRRRLAAPISGVCVISLITNFIRRSSTSLLPLLLTRNLFALANFLCR